MRTAAAVLAAVVVTACVRDPKPPQVIAPGNCLLSATWAQQSLDLWDRASTQLLGRKEPLPYIVYFDQYCAYHIGRRPPGVLVDQRPLAFRGATLAVWGVRHDGHITLPGARTIPVDVYAAASFHAGEPFYAMALPSVWFAKLPRAVHGDHLPEELLTIAQHEMTHTLQMRAFVAFAQTLGLPPTFVVDDNAVQKTFSGDRDYVAAYLLERDILASALTATDRDSKRRLLRHALDLARTRHARFFTGDNAVLAKLDGRFLSMEGLGEWVRYKLITSGPVGLLPKLDPAAAFNLLRGSEPFWSQEHGLLVVLLLEQLMPGFQDRLLASEVPDAFALLDEIAR